jgi:hypothetical protein
MDIKDRPYVFLTLPKRLHDVIRHESKVMADGFLLDGESILGLFIIDRVSPDLFPPKRPTSDESIKLYLPVNERNKYAYENYYFCIKPFYREQILNEVNLFLRNKAWQWDIEGRKMGYGEKQIVESFLSAWGMRQSEDAYEMIKKIMYRERRKTREEIARNISGKILKHSPRVVPDKIKRKDNPELYLFEDE